MDKVLVLLVGLFVIQKCQNIKIEEEEGVLIGNDSNLDRIIGQNQQLLINFYAPWCGHCQQLDLEYQKVGQQFRSEGRSIKLVKVDVSENKESVQYLKWFDKGMQSDYDGGNKAGQIVEWIYRKIGPVVQRISLQKLQGIIDREKVVYVVVGDIGQMIEQVAKKADSFQIFNVEELEGYSSGDLVVIKDLAGIKKKIRCEGCNSQEDVQWFIDSTRIDDVIEFDYDAVQYTFGGYRSFMVLFWEQDKHKEQKQMLVDASVEVRKQGLIVSYSQIEKDIGKGLADYIGVEVHGLPRVMIIDLEVKSDISRFTFKGDINVEGMVEFAKRWRKKQLKKDVKSAEVPIEAYDGDIRVLVGINFDKVVYQDYKDVFVWFYVPWCGYCRELESIYQKIAGKYREFDKLVVAKVDASENEVEGIEVKQFPMLKLFKKGVKVPVDYDKKLREEVDFDVFLAENVEGLKEFREATGQTEFKQLTKQDNQEIKEEL